jgi:hypothetical protein
MRTYENSTKKNLFLVVALLISMSTVLNAQNVLRKMNAKAKFQYVKLDYLKAGSEPVVENTEKTFFFNITNLGEMHNLNLHELNNLVNESLRLAGGKMFGFTSGSPKEEIIVTVDKQRKEYEEGLATIRFARNVAMPIVVKFILNERELRLVCTFNEMFFPKKTKLLKKVRNDLEIRTTILQA